MKSSNEKAESAVKTVKKLMRKAAGSNLHYWIGEKRCVKEFLVRLFNDHLTGAGVPYLR